MAVMENESGAAVAGARSRRRRRNYVLFGILAGFALLTFLVTLVKLAHLGAAGGAA